VPLHYVDDIKCHAFEICCVTDLLLMVRQQNKRRIYHTSFVSEGGSKASVQLKTIPTQESRDLNWVLASMISILRFLSKEFSNRTENNMF
jgi:hypothetical protein